MIHTLLITDREITYDGRQLASHWMYRHFNLLGDAINELLTRYAAEIQDIWQARCKVRAVT